MLKEIITVREAARRKGVHPDTIYAAMKRDEINGVRCADKVMAFVEDVERYQPKKVGRPANESCREEERRGNQ